MTKDTEIYELEYALSMIISSAQLAVYDSDKAKKRRFLERIEHHAETIKRYLEESK